MVFLTSMLKIYHAPTFAFHSVNPLDQLYWNKKIWHDNLMALRKNNDNDKTEPPLYKYDTVHL